MLVSVVKNGGVFKDKEGRSDIIDNPTFEALIGKTIEQPVGKGDPAVYNNWEELTPFLEEQFKIAKADWEVKLKTYPLKEFLRSVETSFNSEISEEDVYKNHIDLVKKSDGTFLTLVKTEKGSSTKVNFQSDKDVKDYIRDVYEIQRRLQTEKDAAKVRENNAKSKETSKKPENEPDIKSINDIKTLGLKLINELGYTFEKIVAWLMDKLLNKKLTEQEKAIDSKEAITSLAEGMFRKEFGGDEKNVDLEGESFKAKVLEMDKSGKYKNVTLLVNDLKNSFRDDGLDFDFSLLVKKTKSILASKTEAKEESTTKEEDKDKTAEAKADNEADQKVIDEAEEQANETEDETIQEKFSVLEPELWENIQNFTSLEELENMAKEFSAAGEWKKSLAMCMEVIALGNIETAVNWTAPQIIDWFDKYIKSDESNNANIEDVESEEVEQSEFDLKEVLNSPNSKHFKNSVIKLIRKYEDSKELRNAFITALKSDLAVGKQSKRMKNITPEDFHSMMAKTKRNIEEADKNK